MDTYVINQLCTTVVLVKIVIEYFNCYVVFNKFNAITLNKETRNVHDGDDSMNANVHICKYSSEHKILKKDLFK